MFVWAYTPEQKMENMATEIDRLYLEKCKEVNRLEQKVEKYKSMAEIAVKQKRELEKQLEEMKQEALTADLISREKVLEAVSSANMTLFSLPQKVMKYADEILSQFEYRQKVLVDMIAAIPAVSSASVRELAAEPLKGFFPDVEPPEELPENLLEELPVWTLQTVSSQDILCFSSALKNLHDIKESDSGLYNKLERLLEKAIDNYCGEE